MFTFHILSRFSCLFFMPFTILYSHFIFFIIFLLLQVELDFIDFFYDDLLDNSYVELWKHFCPSIIQLDIEEVFAYYFIKLRGYLLFLKIKRIFDCYSNLRSYMSFIFNVILKYETSPSIFIKHLQQSLLESLFLLINQHLTHLCLNFFSNYLKKTNPHFKVVFLRGNLIIIYWTCCIVFEVKSYFQDKNGFHHNHNKAK